MKRKRRTWLASLMLVAYLAFTSSAGAATLVNDDFILSASNGLTGEYFGIWADIDGTWAVIGARNADDPLYPGNQIGAAYVYDYNGTSWVQNAQLVPASGDWGGRIGEFVAVQGNVAVVGAQYQTYGTAGAAAGAAWVFEYESGAWVEKAMLTASDGVTGDHFGSVAIDGDNIVIGAPLADVDTLTDVGAAYVFNRNQGGANAWGQVQKLTMATPVAGAKMNYVAIDDGTIVAGAYGQSAAYVFEYNGLSSTWSQTAQLVGSGTDTLGRSVDIQGDLITAGAPGANKGYLFGRDQGGAGTWGQVAALSASRLTGGVGQSTAIINSETVAFSGNLVDVPTGMSDEGAAFVFRKDTGTGQWAETNMLAASTPTAGDNLGNCIAASGNTLLAGAMFGDGQQANSGTAYVFNVPATGTPIVTPEDPGPGPGGTVVAGGTTPYAWYRTDVEGAIVTTDDPYYPGNPQTLYLADQTTNGRTLSVKKGNPLVTSNAPSGETTLTLDGNDVMVCLPEDFGHAQPGTVFAVWHATAYDPQHANDVTYVYDAGVADPLQRQFFNYMVKTSTDPDPHVEAGSGPEAGTTTYNLGTVEQTVLDQWVISSVSYADGVEDFIRINGTQIFTGDLAAGTGMNGLVLGADRRGDRYEFVGDFAELVVFEGELTTTEIAAIEAALYARWFQTVQIPGDATGNGVVDALDAQRLAENWGATTQNPAYDTWWKMGDFNGDQAVNAADASILAANWGSTGESSAVPEPSILALLLAGGLLWSVRRARR